MNYRLGLDIGTNSLGWCVLDLGDDDHVVGLRDSGVRIFSDGRNPKDKTSLALARRLARQARRRRDRYLKRRDRLLQALVKHGLMPQDLKERSRLVELDPYALRGRGLDERISLHELGRAIFHINQRRGFKSIRIATSADDEDEGLIKSAISETRHQIEANNCRTLGEYLYKRRINGHTVRARRGTSKSKAPYELYFDRAMTEQELDALFAAQQEFYKDTLSPAICAEIADIVLFQRPLLPVEPGRCTFESTESRAPLALLASQRFRIYQEVNNLRLIDPQLEPHPLSIEQRDILVAALEKKQKVTFAGIRRLLTLSRDWEFNLEGEARKDLKGNLTSAALGHKKCLGAAWYDLDPSTQEQLVNEILQATNDDDLIQALIDDLGLTEEQAVAACQVSLPQGYGRLSFKAISKILPHLMADVITYDKAALAAGYHHSMLYDGVIHDDLPYYGEVLERYAVGGSGAPDDPDEIRFGRIANPTVHVGLNQVRKVVNTLIKRYGRPHQVILEVVRDLKLNQLQKARIRKQQAENARKNEQFAEILANHGLPNNYDNRLLLKLWEELDLDEFNRTCPFTGESISISKLFSSEVEIEHLLPFAQSLDDSIANKTICVRRANKDKNNRSPYEAFSRSPSGYNWLEITQRASNLPPNKRWRFADDAMDRLRDEGGDFLARHLNDTAYVSRVAREYLTAVCPPNCVWTVPGRLTAHLRYHWGLNSVLSDTNQKDRTDHRHHAIDAIVIGNTDRSTLQSASKSSRKQFDNNKRIVTDLKPPFPNFRQKVEDSVSHIVVSFKPDHGIAGGLHNETAYGLAGPVCDGGKTAVVYRKPLLDLRSTEIHKVRDPIIKNRLATQTEGKSGKALADALQSFHDETGIRRIRLTEDLSVIPINNGAGKPFKAVKGDANYCMEIVTAEKGKWWGEIISRFVANQAGYKQFCMNKRRFRKTAFSGADLIMRLCKDDCIAINGSKGRRIYRVVKFSGTTINFAEQNEAGNLKSRNANPNDNFKYLIKSPERLHMLSARRVFIDPIGRVKDPGPL